MTKNIIYVGQLHDNSGYGVAARNNLKCILSDDEKILSSYKIEAFSQSFELNSNIKLSNSFPKINDVLLSDEAAKKKKKGSYELVIHLPIPTAFFTYLNPDSQLRYLVENSSVNHCLTTWETDLLPDNWDKMASEMRITNFAVPSTWNKEVFEKMFSPVEVVPHPINTEVSICSNPFSFESQIEDLFKVVAINQWNVRKDFETLVRSFYMAFYDNPKAILIIKSYFNLMSPDLSQDSKFIMSQIDAIKNSVFKADGSAPKCKTLFLGGVMEKEKLNRLIDISNVYMSCTRGEGFGLPISEAMCLKKPVIVPGATGHMDFVPKGNFIMKGHWDRVHSLPGYHYESNVYYTHINSAVDQLKSAYKLYKEDNEKMRQIGEDNFRACQERQFTQVGVVESFHRMLEKSN